MDFSFEGKDFSFETFLNAACIGLSSYHKDVYHNSDDLVYPQTMLLFALAENTRIIVERLVELTDNLNKFNDEEFISNLMKMPLNPLDDEGEL